METTKRRGQKTIREAQLEVEPVTGEGTGAFGPEARIGGAWGRPEAGSWSTFPGLEVPNLWELLQKYFAPGAKFGPPKANVKLAEWKRELEEAPRPRSETPAEETLTIQEFLNSLLPTDLTGPPRTGDQFRSTAPFPFWPRTDPDLPVELTPLSGMDIATGEPIDRPEQLTPVPDKLAFPEIDETNIDSLVAEVARLKALADSELEKPKPDYDFRANALARAAELNSIATDLVKDADTEDERIYRAGVLQDAQDREDRLRGEAEARGDVLRRQTQQFGLLSTLLPLLLQQQQQQAQFGQTQGLAQQRFAQEQAQTRRFETEQQAELQRTQDQRQQAASLIPQLFPNMEINEEILSGGIDPSLIPVLISLARLRAEQDVSGQRSTRQPIVTFAR
jgi:hypothetical protein